MEAYASTAWTTQVERLSSLAGFCRTRGITLLVTTFPFVHAQDDYTDYEPAHEQLARLWEGLGVAHLDLRRALGELPAKELRVGGYDAHPNERAHDLAAQALLPFVRTVLEARPNESEGMGTDR